MTDSQVSRPLKGVRVIEFAGIGPGPHAVTMLADLGCDVIRIERSSKNTNELPDYLTKLGLRGRTTIAIDLKSEGGQQAARALIDDADVLFEGYRPGVMERLGVGPERFTETNPGLMYVRLTGWGQDGPYAQTAGHDINYIGLTGALAAIGSSDMPVPPLNLVGDFAGGSMFALIGVLAGLLERVTTGKGSVVDVAMIDGVSSLLAPIRDMADAGLWSDQRASNMLDGGAPFYRTYRTSDGLFMAVGALEPLFYSIFVEGLGIAEAELPNRFDPSNWPDLEVQFADRFAGNTRAHWERVFDGTDACVTPVLTMSDAPNHPHHQARADAEPQSSLLPRFDGRILGATGTEGGWDRMVELLVASGLSAEAVEEMTLAEAIGPGSVSREHDAAENRHNATQ